MKAVKTVIFILAALCAVAAALLLWRPKPRRRQAAAIGIIGGADGPTAIYTGSGVLLTRLSVLQAVLRLGLQAGIRALNALFAKMKTIT